MKRIVQCPTCEAKLSVLDLGKPITPKCPKCGNTFDVTSEGVVDAPAAETQPAPPLAPGAMTDGKTVSSPAAPRLSASAPVAPAEPAPVAGEPGPSLLQVILIPALLFIIIVVQVVTFKKTQSHLNTLSAQIQALSKKGM